MRRAREVNTPKTVKASPYVCRPVSMPKDIFDFATTKAKRIGEQQGEPENFSKYIRDLIREDKAREEAK